MPDLFAWAKKVPDWATQVPGVWTNKNGSGYRIPYNAHGLLDWPLPARFVERPLPSWTADVAPLRPHQQAALVKALSRTAAHVWAPPGAGKTLIGLLWVGARPGTSLVVTRAMGRRTWAEESTKWLGREATLLIGRSPGSFRADPRLIYVTAWETLIDWKDALLGNRWMNIVYDEEHWAKQNKRAKPIVLVDGTTLWEQLDNTSSVARQLTDHASYRLGMTATPIPNRTRDLWAQLDLIEPWQWGGFKGFGTRYCDGHSNGYGMVYDGMSNIDELNARLLFVKHLTKQATLAAELPPFRRQVVWLSKDVQDRPESGFARDIRVAVAAAATGNDEEHGGLLEVLLQESATRKRTYVIETILSAARCGQKTVVFTGRRRDCERLAVAVRVALGKNNLGRVAFWSAHGGDSTDVRDRIRNEYMATRGAAIIISTGDSFGEAINLQDTDLALFVMLPWTPRQLRQWEGRFPRLGQTRPCLVMYVVAEGTVDEDMADVVLGKLPPVEQVAGDDALSILETSFHPIPTRSLLERVANL